MIYSPIWIIFFPATFILSDFIHIYFHTVFSEKTNTKIYIYILHGGVCDSGFHEWVKHEK